MTQFNGARTHGRLCLALSALALHTGCGPMDDADLADAQSSIASEEAGLDAEAADLPPTKYTYWTETDVSNDLDIYLPAKRAPVGGFPVVVYVHGGGWNSGDRTSIPSSLLRSLRARGLAVVSIDYRLVSKSAPWTNQAPAAPSDVAASIQFLRANSGAHGMGLPLNAARIGGLGESAGGHLISLQGTTGNEGTFNSRLYPARFKSRLSAVVENFGITEFSQDANDAYHHNPAVLKIPFGREFMPGSRFEPLAQVSADDPPFKIFHGEEDPTVPPAQSAHFFRALQNARAEAGVVSRDELTMVQNAKHSFAKADAIKPLVPSLSFIYRDIANFFARTL